MHPRHTPLAVLAAVLLALPTARAQQPFAAASGPGGVAMMRHGPADEEPRFDFEFPGGPLAAFLDVLRAASLKASATAVNVIVPPGLEDEPMPPMRFTGISVAEVLTAVTEASPSLVTDQPVPGFQRYRHESKAFGFRMASNGPHPIWVFWKSSPDSGPQLDPNTGMPVLAIQMAAPPPPMPPEPRKEPEQVRVINLRRYLDTGLEVEDITTAIRTGCELLPEGGQPKLTFHQETSLLLCRGRADQLELIFEVLAQLGDSSVPRPSISRPGRPTPAQVPLPAAPAVPPESPRKF